MTPPRCTADTCTSPARIVGEGFTLCWWCWMTARAQQPDGGTETTDNPPEGPDGAPTGQEHAS